MMLYVHWIMLSKSMLNNQGRDENEVFMLRIKFILEKFLKIGLRLRLIMED